MKSQVSTLLCVGCLLPLATCFVEIRPSKACRSVLPATKDKTSIAVTREEGKNAKLIDAIRNLDDLREAVEILELPCIEHASGPDYDSLAGTLANESWDYVAVTSPEAAKVLASAWDVVRDDPISVVAVGKATEKVLAKFNIPVAFVPSKATAETLAEELQLKDERTSLLYPASARARDTLQSGLEARGFHVKRLNTYDTVTTSWSEEQKQQAKRVKIACFASPSSIKGWLLNTGDNNRVIAACIGETSATACRGHSWSDSQIFYPASPGIEGWVEAIRDAVEDVKLSHAL